MATSCETAVVAPIVVVPEPVASGAIEAATWACHPLTNQPWTKAQKLKGQASPGRPVYEAFWGPVHAEPQPTLPDLTGVELPELPRSKQLADCDESFVDRLIAALEAAIGRPIPIADGPAGDAQTWCVAAILTANAKNTTGSGPAFLNLCSMGGPADWAELSLAPVQKLIMCKGCYVEPAKAVLQVCGALPVASLGKGGYWTNSALEKLARDGVGLEKKVKGLGEKTASCVYLYYSHFASHFVIDINCHGVVVWVHCDLRGEEVWRRVLQLRVDLGVARQRLAKRTAARPVAGVPAGSPRARAS